ncbi:Zinc finger protein [Lachnellula hyalina]|uniref:Zinc finger protein n=1 Tax=Lachnellula hyalina TaxID=1316788 RepID=A0A8H8R0K9_9HELO|nr:Zinc finger protein [Lachnellula hyalina]TVY26138.1 Zinc finger protein [Lachnellula hyalina]
MAKRSRDDFEPPSDLDNLGDTPAVSITHFSASKFLQLDPDSSSGETTHHTEMRCSLPPHRETLSFPSLEIYEVHYNKTHLNRCLECRKNFPTEHFLNLHIEENHDALVSVRRERGEKTYGCFVEDCDRICSTPQKRRMHLIDKHLFPKEYDFYVVNDGIDHRNSMLCSGRHRRRSSAVQHMTEIEDRAKKRNSNLETIASAPGGDVKGQDGTESSEKDVDSLPSSDDADMEGLTGAMSSLKFVPPSVRFGRGRGRGRGGFSRRT